MSDSDCLLRCLVGLEFDLAGHLGALEQEDEREQAEEQVGEHAVLVHVGEQGGLALDLPVEHGEAGVRVVGGGAAGGDGAVGGGEALGGAAWRAGFDAEMWAPR